MASRVCCSGFFSFCIVLSMIVSCVLVMLGTNFQLDPDKCEVLGCNVTSFGSLVNLKLDERVGTAWSENCPGKDIVTCYVYDDHLRLVKHYNDVYIWTSFGLSNCFLFLSTMFLSIALYISAPRQKRDHHLPALEKNMRFWVDPSSTTPIPISVTSMPSKPQGKTKIPKIPKTPKISQSTQNEREELLNKNLDLIDLE